MKKFLTIAAAIACGTVSFVQTTQAQTTTKKDYVTFKLTPAAKFQACLSDGSGYAPSANVTVYRGKLNDQMFLTTEHMKPGLQFDLFTIQRSSLLADGTPDPNFKSFGLAWYQSDIEVSEGGTSITDIKTILLDQIFGFDPDYGLPPTATFHVGFWFNKPEDAAACGFDVTKPTPFNGEHKAGPLAMISVPDAQSGLGPLCSDPDPTHPGYCHP